jgi:hypothetical protein
MSTHKDVVLSLHQPPLVPSYLPLTVISLKRFVGRTASAAPCAILLDIAEMLDPLLDARTRWVDQTALVLEDEDVDG